MDHMCTRWPDTPLKSMKSVTFSYVANYNYNPANGMIKINMKFPNIILHCLVHKVAYKHNSLHFRLHHIFLNFICKTLKESSIETATPSLEICPSPFKCILLLSPISKVRFFPVLIRSIF